MNTITISLPEDRLKALERLSRQFNLAPEELVRISVEELTRREKDFKKAISFVQERNDSLYQLLKASESVLAKEWDTPEEDETWAHL